jgi:predicted phage tail protein
LATGYNIYKSTCSGCEAAPAALTVAGGKGVSTSGTVTGLTNGTRYYFLIQATNAGGHSPSSAEVSTVAGLPAAPTNVTVSSGNGSATLHWTASALATGYNIYKSTCSGCEAAPVALAVAGGSSTSGTVTGLTNGTRYYFLIQATNAGGHSPSSAEATTVAGLPAAPAGVSAVPGAAVGSVTLSWTASALATGYNIYKATCSGCEAAPVALAVAGGNSTGGTVTGLTTGTKYFFVVQAVNAGGHSPSSNEASAVAQ